jgi:hypothetical protein
MGGENYSNLFLFINTFDKPEDKQEVAATK